MQTDQVLSALYECFRGKGWRLYTCTTCNNLIFSKNAKTLCWRRKECGQEKKFLSLPKQKAMVVPGQIKDVIEKAATKKGYNRVESIPLTANHGKTDLIIAGVQLYNDVIHGKAIQSCFPDRCVISQPCVRMQFADKVGKVDGISTAFVNTCTEHVGATVVEHAFAVDFWLDVLSCLGLHVCDVSLVYRTKKRNWGTGDFLSHDLFFMYGDLELGDASYAVVPTRCAGGSGVLQISDVGFGVERIGWAINKTDTYYDVLQPWDMQYTTEVNDLYRTLTLLAMTGVKPGPKGAGLQFRRLAKQLYLLTPNIFSFGLVSYYFRYWGSFTTCLCGLEVSSSVISREYDRLRNNGIASNNNWPAPKNDESTEEYLERMVYSKIVTPSELRKMYTP